MSCWWTFACPVWMAWLPGRDSSLPPADAALLITAFDDPQTMHEVLAAGPDVAAAQMRPAGPGSLRHSPGRERPTGLSSGCQACSPPPVLPPRSNYPPASWTSSPLSPKASATAKSHGTCISSANTVKKFHLQNIHQRLGVENRTETLAGICTRRRPGNLKRTRRSPVPGTLLPHLP